MIEEKLQEAANRLPECRYNFLAVEEKAKEKTNRPKPVRRRRLAIAMVRALLLVGCVAVTEPEYYLYNGNWAGFLEDGLSNTPNWAWQETQKECEKLGLLLPETLGDFPVIDFGRYNLTTKKVPIQIAWLAPRYVYSSCFYGVVNRELWVTPDGIECERHWKEGAEVTYGSISEDVWQRQFGYDTNNVYVGSNYTRTSMPVEEIFPLDLDGITLYVAKVSASLSEKPLWHVTWVDNANGWVISVDGYFDSAKVLIRYAQEIIDLNK